MHCYNVGMDGPRQKQDTLQLSKWGNYGRDDTLSFWMKFDIEPIVYPPELGVEWEELNMIPKVPFDQFKEWSWHEGGGKGYWWSSFEGGDEDTGFGQSVNLTFILKQCIASEIKVRIKIFFKSSTMVESFWHPTECLVQDIAQRTCEINICWMT